MYSQTQKDDMRQSILMGNLHFNATVYLCVLLKVRAYSLVYTFPSYPLVIGTFYSRDFSTLLGAHKPGQQKVLMAYQSQVPSLPSQVHICILGLEKQSRLSALLKDTKTTPNIVVPMGLEPKTLGSRVEYLNH